MIKADLGLRDIDIFPQTARVWIYQSDREIPEGQAAKVHDAVYQFAQQWTSHNQALKATGGLLHRRFLVLMVNEYVAGVSGCSIDSSVAFVKQLGQALQVDFMDRLNFAYLDGDEVKTVHKQELPQAYSKGDVDDSTLFFDNLVNNKSDFVTRWKKPLADGWMKRFCQG